MKRLLLRMTIVALVSILAACNSGPVTSVPTTAAPTLAPATTQQATKVHRVGVLSIGSPPSDPSRQTAGNRALIETLRTLGYIEGQNIVLEYRWVRERPDLIPSLVAELVNLPVDVIWLNDSTSLEPAIKATRTIPIVTYFLSPAEEGASMHPTRPASNVTGVAYTSSKSLADTWLRHLKAVVPSLARVAVFTDSTTDAGWRDLEQVAQVRGVHLIPVLVQLPNPDFESAIQKAVQSQADALLTRPGPTTNLHADQIMQLAVRHKLPTMNPLSRYTEAGGLMSCGVNFDEMARRAATGLAKLLQGAKPADIPIEPTTQIECIINLKTAQALGLTIPQSILDHATQVIR
jgi:putative tryptophan/tyrosine transport system substrate-binding protein